MEELEERIQAVLRDPQQMQEIFSIARSLGLELPPQDGAPGDTSPERTPAQPPEPGEAGKPPVPPGLGGAITQPVAELLTQAGKLEKKQENLLNALKPFLKPGRREKIERAMQAARLSHLAGYALRSRRDQHQT